jgi:hypothetical protein
LEINVSFSLSPSLSPRGRGERRAASGESRNGMDVGGGTGLVLITPPQTERVADNVIASVSITP